MVLRFRTYVLVGVSGLLLLLAASTVISVVTLVDRRARVRLDEHLDRSREVFESVQKFRRTQLRVEGRVVAEEPRLKAVMATADVTPETIEEVAREMQKILECDLFLLIDGNGRAVARLGAPTADPEQLASGTLVTTALARGEAAGLWTLDEQVFLAVARRLSLGERSIGALVLGYRIDAGLTDAVNGQTGGTVLVALGDRLLTGSGPRIKTSPPAALAALVAALPERGPGDHRRGEVRLGDERYVGFAAPLEAGEPSSPRYAIMLSLDEALAAGSSLKQVIVIAAALAALAGLLFSIVLARRMSRPLDDLVRFSQKVGAGGLETRAEPAGPREVRQLGAAMNDMVAHLQVARTELLRAEKNERRVMVEKVALARELSVARSLQESLLPGEAPVIGQGLRFVGVCLPASHCGGDWWGYHELSDGRTLLLIGDVTGHGIDSAMITATAKASKDVACFVHEADALTTGRLLDIMNRAIYESTRGALLMTCFACIVDPRAGTARFSNAGHEFPFVLGRGPGRRAISMMSLGDPLGFSPTTKYEERTVTLERDDTIVLYTDGVIDLRNLQGEKFGEKRLRKLLERDREREPAEMLAGLLAEATRYAVGREQDDDIALVIGRLGECGRPG